ncbi:TonB-dependent receptor [Gammaproteobacteria bacterium]|jgi:iron complex outermembrane receptor protein|nr:TonB-dependent receptor [Gammaproteobacteria bacterium]
MKNSLSLVSISILGLIVAVSTFDIKAQDSSKSSALIEEVITTARKKEENQQVVPISISTVSSEQIEVLKIRDLTEIASIPNVSLDEVGTANHVPNFQIRGLGHNSSIASIESPVAMINDGVYIGNGIVTDGFDIDSIQVLRGPQGTVMGKNSIGGAVLVNSKNPGDEWESKLRLAYDGFGSPGGMSSYVQFATGGPISDNLKVRGVVHINDNDGWHKNMFNNSNHGAIESTMFRGTVVYEPSETMNINIKYTSQETDGDGPSAQCFQLFEGGPSCLGMDRDRNSFDLSIDEPGFLKDNSDSLVVKVEKDVAFGDGLITYIYGDSEYTADSIGDIDGTMAFIFHAPNKIKDALSSHELRFNGSFENFDLLAGYSINDRDLIFHEMRILPSTLPSGSEWNGGGDLTAETSAFFITAEIPLSEKLTLDVGVRKTDEDKSVSIASLSAGVAFLAQGAPSNVYLLMGRDPSVIQSPNQASCQIFSGGCIRDFVDNDSWSSTSPRIGLTYIDDNDTTYYGYRAIAYRSGGYNMRNTAILVLTPEKGPGPFDQEEVTTTEFGIKKSLGTKGRVNFAYFSSELTDMQRTLNEAGPAGPVQYIKNTGDASMSGLELDMVYMIQDDLVLNLNVGTLNAKYDDVVYDISGDGVIDYKEYELELPRAADLTYSIGLSKDFNVGNWSANSRVSYSYRDPVAYDDGNLGIIDEQKILDLGVDFYSPSENMSIGVYGKNMNESVKHGNISPVSWGSFAPVMIGKVVGVELVYDF